MGARAWRRRKGPGKRPAEAVEATLGRRRSSAAGSHGDRRTRRLRARDAQQRRAIEDQQ